MAVSGEKEALGGTGTAEASLFLDVMFKLLRSSRLNGRQLGPCIRVEVASRKTVISASTVKLCASSVSLQIEGFVRPHL